MAFLPVLLRTARQFQQTLDIKPVNALAYAGRHSLLIYLVHQPLLFLGMSLFVN